MKLLGNTASPFARKALVCIHERAITDQVDVLDVMLSPVAPNADVQSHNPLGKIPTLVLDNGGALYDSRVVCEYLDTVGERPPLFPLQGVSRFAALRRQAVADGIMDAAVGARYETFLRPEEKQWPQWIDGQIKKFRQSLDTLESEAADFADTVDIGTIAVACALGYLDFRYADENWSDSHPHLAAWYERFASRPSMTATAPA